MTNIEALIEDGGNVTLGAVGSLACVAAAADQHNALAMLVRRDGERVTDLLARLDVAIEKYIDTDEVTDEINAPRV